MIDVPSFLKCANQPQCTLCCNPTVIQVDIIEAANMVFYQSKALLNERVIKIIVSQVQNILQSNTAQVEKVVFAPPNAPQAGTTAFFRSSPKHVSSPFWSLPAAMLNMLNQHHLSQKSLCLQLQDVRLEGRDGTTIFDWRRSFVIEIPRDQKMAGTLPIPRLESNSETESLLVTGKYRKDMNT